MTDSSEKQDNIVKLERSTVDKLIDHPNRPDDMTCQQCVDMLTIGGAGYSKEAALKECQCSRHCA